MKKALKICLIIIAVILMLFGLVALAGFLKFNFSDSDIKIVETPIITTTVGLANPASTNCVDKGGRLEIKTKADGSQYGICYFEDNRQCEEWALLRGECPVGGVKITGYDNEDQSYCAITGGQDCFDRFSDWTKLTEAIANCRVKEVMQAHNLTVTAKLKDGQQIVAQEPAIDQVFTVVEQNKAKCGEIIMATE